MSVTLPNMETELTKFRDWLTGELRKKGWTQRMLADFAGLSETTVSGWFNDRSPPSRRSARAIAEALGIDEKTVFEKAGIPERKRPTLHTFTADTVRPVRRVQEPRPRYDRPVRGLESLTPVRVLGRAPADVPRWTNVVEPHDLLRTEDVAPLSDPALVIASGDCLIERGIEDGTRVLIDCAAIPQRQGDIVVLRIADEVTMKEWHPLEDGRVALRASSDRYPPTYIKPEQEDVEIIGVVHHWYRIQRP